MSAMPSLLADTTLIAVEQQAVKVGRAMAKNGGPADVEKCSDFENILRGLSATHPIRQAAYRGYTTGYAKGA